MLILKVQVNKCPPKRPFFDNFDTWQKDGIFNSAHKCTNPRFNHIKDVQPSKLSIMSYLPSLVCNSPCTFLTTNTIKCTVTTRINFIHLIGIKSQRHLKLKREM